MTITIRRIIGKHIVDKLGGNYNISEFKLNHQLPYIRISNYILLYLLSDHVVLCKKRPGDGGYIEKAALSYASPSLIDDIINGLDNLQ